MVFTISNSLLRIMVFPTSDLGPITVMEWIKIIDGFPKPETRVLVFPKNGSAIVVSKIVNDKHRGAHWRDDDQSTFTIEHGDHWMPLPEPPRK